MADFIRSLFGIEYETQDPNDVRSTFLFVEPSAATGAGRTFDLWGGFDLYSYSASPREADARALYADWRVVGQDLRTVMIAESKNLAVD